MPNKITFRELNTGDAIRLYEVYSDNEAMKYRGSKPMQTIEDANKYVRNSKVSKGQTQTIRKGIELVSSKELIGSVMFRFDKNKTNVCEIGYSIGHDFWGRGLGKETVEAMIKAIEKNHETEEIIAWSNKKNIASIKILEKIGFQRIEQSESQDNFIYRRIANKI